MTVSIFVLPLLNEVCYLTTMHNLFTKGIKTLDTSFQKAPTVNNNDYYFSYSEHVMIVL